VKILSELKMNLSEKLAQTSGNKSSKIKSIEAFNEFKSDVDNELLEWTSRKISSEQHRNKLLNGGANTAAFLLIDESVRKEFGIFFSGHELANNVASKIASSLANGASVIDPTCGAGDLLIACARHYPKQVNYEATLSYWGARLGGIDIHQAFTDTVSSRLKLLATESHISNKNQSDSQSHFPRVITDDALEQMKLIGEFDLVVTNPPYGSSQAPSDLEWSQGKVQTAAVFIDRILKHAKPNQEILAILPDVLRSGSRYDKWRDWVASKADILSVEVVGKFDKTTDVDVFVMHLRVGQNPNQRWPDINLPEVNTTDVKIETLFNVRVGPVVPHRSEQDGSPRLYIDCSHTSNGKEITPTQVKKYKGTPYKGPFVVVNRTSSPDDPSRLVASIIKTNDLVMVENHLIIIQPIDGQLKTCHKLLTQLKSESVREWINQRIRCRHLTVTSIKEIPINWR
jgi:predicted RNA methylase